MKLAAITPATPSFWKTLPIGRAEPTAKFSPATMMSPGCTWSLQPGRFAEKQYLICSSTGSRKAAPGKIRSVLMSSPNTQAVLSLCRAMA
ncbi:MAG: hypothetical protein OXR03_26055 [Rhodospirillaceae bacterium]|nr:hypothetical protein [Rhodospirillaceae bacterium]